MITYSDYEAVSGPSCAGKMGVGLSEFGLLEDLIATHLRLWALKNSRLKRNTSPSSIQYCCLEDFDVK